MINPKVKLNSKLFTPNIEKLATRDGYGKGLLDLGKKNKNVIVLCADLAESTRTEWFKEKYPHRFIELGVAEQNLCTVGSGMANYGKIPFISTFAVFSPGRNLEQIRTTICLNNLPVKIASTHAGVSTGPDGATHQALDDIALTRVMPNMTVIVPCDAIEAQKATIAAAKTNSPVYLRFGRSKMPIITTAQTPFKIGQAQVLTRGKDVTLIACGYLVYEALLAAKKLHEQGISVEVINNHTIKPLDKKTILSSVRQSKAVVTVEEHQVMGGMGSAVLEMLAKNYPVPVELVGVEDCFGQSGEVSELFAEYKLSSNNIITAVKKVLKRK